MKKMMILFFAIYLAIQIFAIWLYQINSGLSWSNQLLYERAGIVTFMIIAVPIFSIHIKQNGWRPAYLKKR